MIRTVIKGGLGNQMFQYAYGKVLSEHYGLPLLLDLSFFEKATADRQYVLGDLIADEATINIKPARWKLSFWKRMLPLNLLLLRCRLPPLCCVYLDGYWQSEKFFLGNDSLVRSLFKFPDPPPELQDAVINSTSVAVHVRRGDYVSNARRHICHLDYFLHAMQRGQEDLGPVRFFIFSDDIEWCEEIRKEFPDAVLVRGCTSDAQELCLMSLCKHAIISNSSFSWWAAWLQESSGKRVYAPDRWIDDDKMNHQFMVVDNILPTRWEKISIVNGAKG